MPRAVYILIAFLMLATSVPMVDAARGRLRHGQESPGGTVPPPPSPSFSCPPSGRDPNLVRYAAPGGTGNGSVNSPYRVQDFMSQAQAGWTLCLSTGTYTSSNGGLLIPIAGRSGTSGTDVNGFSRTILVGAVDENSPPLFTGNFSTDPVSLKNNDWWELQGIEAIKGERDTIFIGGGTNNTTVKRSIFADVIMAGNNSVCQITDAAEILFEDVACIGNGRKVLGPTQGVTAFKCRRCYVQFQGSTSLGPTAATLDYNGIQYKFENLIANWNEIQMPNSYTRHDFWPPTPQGSTVTGGRTVGGGKGAAVAERQDGGSGTSALSTNSDTWGGIAYIKSSDRNFQDHACAATFQGPAPWGMSDFRWKDQTCIVEPGHPMFGSTSVRAMRLQNMDAGGSGLTADRITTIGTFLADNQWTVTNQTNYADKTAMNNPANGQNGGPFSLTTTRARNCFRYVDGVYTSTPLWPWPMNERIRQFTSKADRWSNYPFTFVNSNGQAICPTCVGGPQANRTIIDVTADIERVMGTIPAPCRS